MPRHNILILSAATIVAAFWLSGCAHEGSVISESVTPPPSTVASAVPGAPLPDPVTLTDLLGRLADPAVPGADKLSLVQDASAADATSLENFTKALQDNHMIPLIFTATGLSWSDQTPGNLIATVSAAGPDPKVGGFTFPMEFTPAGTGWQLSRKTADMLLVFGDSPGPPASGTLPLPPPPEPVPPPAPTPTR